MRGKYNLPLDYHSIPIYERRLVREQYIQEQDGICYYCKHPLEGPPPKQVTDKHLRKARFPENFLSHPVHLHHDHRTGLTLGAVHAYCNGVLWQYHGE